MEKEMQQMGKTWSSTSVTAKDRQKWRDHVAALHATQRNGHEWVSDKNVWDISIYYPTVLVIVQQARETTSKKFEVKEYAKQIPKQ